jgi:hypothetical protein
LWLASLLLVNRLHELAYHQRHTLDALDLFLCPDQLALQTPLLILDVLFLLVDVPAPVSDRS